MSNDPEPRSYTAAELIGLVLEEDRKIKELPASDAEHPLGYQRDNEVGGWSLWWGGYDYFVEDERLRNADNLLEWIEHMGEKNWESMTPYRLSRFISSVKAHWDASAS